VCACARVWVCGWVRALYVQFIRGCLSTVQAMAVPDIHRWLLIAKCQPHLTCLAVGAGESLRTTTRVPGPHVLAGAAVQTRLRVARQQLCSQKTRTY